MSSPTPAKIAVPKNKIHAITDTTCIMMCPECYVRGTVVGQEDDGTTWGCPMCGLRFSVQWYT